jgi:hypothetical protein
VETMGRALGVACLVNCGAEKNVDIAAALALALSMGLDRRAVRRL